MAIVTQRHEKTCDMSKCRGFKNRMKNRNTRLYLEQNKQEKERVEQRKLWNRHFVLFYSWAKSFSSLSSHGLIKDGKWKWNSTKKCHFYPQTFVNIANVEQLSSKTESKVILKSIITIFKDRWRRIAVANWRTQ